MGKFTDKQLLFIREAFKSDHLRHKLESANETAKFERRIDRLEKKLEGLDAQNKNLSKQLDKKISSCAEEIKAKSSEANYKIEELTKKLERKNKELAILKEEKQAFARDNENLSDKIQNLEPILLAMKKLSGQYKPQNTTTIFLKDNAS